jgi:hypothetical protein
MKKLFSIIAVIFMLSTANIKAQITLEHSYFFQKTEFWVTDIGNNDYKYISVDSTGFSIYNLDHTLYMPKIVPPITIFQPPKYYDIEYITKSLFDCDTTNIEYVISTAFYTGNYYVYRTDGVLIFERDSATGPFCSGCQDGSVYTQPIFNTPNGTKLMLFSHLPNSNEQDSLHIYSLCGTLPVTDVFDFTGQEKIYVKIFPNPASQKLNFELMLPDNKNQYELSIMNSNAQELRRENTRLSGNKFSIDVQDFSSGTYYYSLASKTKVLQTGKFVLTK